MKCFHTPTRIYIKIIVTYHTPICIWVKSDFENILQGHLALKHNQARRRITAAINISSAKGWKNYIHLNGTPNERRCKFSIWKQRVRSSVNKCRSNCPNQSLLNQKQRYGVRNDNLSNEVNYQMILRNFNSKIHIKTSIKVYYVTVPAIINELIREYNVGLIFALRQPGLIFILGGSAFDWAGQKHIQYKNHKLLSRIPISQHSITITKKQCFNIFTYRHFFRKYHLFCTPIWTYGTIKPLKTKWAYQIR